MGSISNEIVQYLKMRIKYKFYKNMKFVNFQRFALLLQNSLIYLLLPLSYRNDKMTKFPCRRWVENAL